MRAAGETVLFSENAIAARVAELARIIAAASDPPDFAAPILAGAFVFAADLMRALAREGRDLAVEFLWLRSYGMAESAGAVRVLKGPSEAVKNRHVLLIDGVLETGHTLARAKELLLEAGARSVSSAVAVVKPHPAPAFTADHFAFAAGPEFLYGYGMDRAGQDRGLPDIRVRRG